MRSYLRSILNPLVTRIITPKQYSATMSTGNGLPKSDILILDSLDAMRRWRGMVRLEGKEVGFVPTMGALHNGHLSLVRRSLASNDLTVISIFVNPAQFAPHEDLATYPRTLPADLKLLEQTSVEVVVNGKQEKRRPSAVFLPSVKDMYPSGIVQDVGQQKGTFVEVKGYDHQMEGTSRPTFFRGVATVVTKLFNAVEPTRAYFGQKDIQQALLLRRLTRDLLLSHPLSHNLHIIPTYRSSETGLALSSRNAYLTPAEMEYAPKLYAALVAGKQAWIEGKTKAEVLAQARGLVEEASKVAAPEVDIRLDYIEMNDPDTFDVVEDQEVNGSRNAVIISGAMWVGRTRLIDNLILGDSKASILLL